MRNPFSCESRARRFMDKHIPVKTPEGHKEIFEKYTDDLLMLNAEIRVRVKDLAIDYIMSLNNDRDYDISVWDETTIEVRFAEPKATDIFDIPNVVKYFDFYTSEGTLKAFEEAGRTSICNEVINAYQKNPKGECMEYLCATALTHALHEYKDGNETELGRCIWVLGSLGGKVVGDTVPYKQVLDEVDTETIYKAWEQAYEKGLVSVQECEEEMLKRDPDTPECERILEKYQEINKGATSLNA